MMLAPGSFGHPGAGGSLGYADPESGVGYGYVMNQMAGSLAGDPRDGDAERGRPRRASDVLT